MTDLARGRTCPSTCRVRALLAWVLLVGPAVLTGAARAQGPDRLPSVLRWGGDASGGEPYIIERKNAQPAGFEGDLAEYLAGKLGVKSEFVNGDWDQLPNFLRNRQSIDLILNGYEWTPEREQAMLSTIPYYSYRLRLIVRKGSAIRDWDDLKPGIKVGVLTNSAAHRYVETFPGVKVTALSAEGSTGVMRMVAGGQLDATVQDDPVVSWYMDRRKEFPQLRVVGEPVAPGENSYYVIFVRKQDRVLCDRLNDAIRAGLKDGTLRRIYVKYGLWPDEEGDLLRAGAEWPPRSRAVKEETAPGLTWERFLGDLGYGALITVLLTALSMPLAMLIGLLVALGRVFGPRWLAAPLTAYVEIIRGTPVLFQLMVLFFFLPAVTGNLISLPAFWAGVLGLAINYGAYEAENYRAGLLAVPRGQMEAALALGMSKGTAIRRIIVPQAVRLVIPPVTNDFISLFKDTSICSAIAVTELMAYYRTETVNFPQMAVYALLLTGGLYLMMSYPLSLLARRMEQKQGKVRVHG